MTKVAGKIKKGIRKAGQAVEKAVDIAEKTAKKAVKEVKKAVEKITNEMPSTVKGGNIIQFKEWEKIDLRVAKVEKAEDIEGADNLYKLTLSVGSLGKKIACAGLKKHYTKDELKGKKLIYFANIAPRMMRGINSEGMVLASVSDDNSHVILICPEKDIAAGAKVS